MTGKEIFETRRLVAGGGGFGGGGAGFDLAKEEVAGEAGWVCGDVDVEVSAGVAGVGFADGEVDGIGETLDGEMRDV